MQLGAIQHLATSLDESKSIKSLILIIDKNKNKRTIDRSNIGHDEDYFFKKRIN